MHASYKFDPKQVNKLSLTMTFTADLPEWRKIEQGLQAAIDSGDVDSEHLRSIDDCIRNLIKAIDDATGNGYRTQGYSYDCKRIANDEPDEVEAA